MLPLKHACMLNRVIMIRGSYGIHMTHITQNIPGKGRKFLAKTLGQHTKGSDSRRNDHNLQSRWSGHA
jgi:hypothetical protein